MVELLNHVQKLSDQLDHLNLAQPIFFFPSIHISKIPTFHKIHTCCLNSEVKKKEVNHYLRPFTSITCSIISSLFDNFGLLLIISTFQLR